MRRTTSRIIRHPSFAPSAPSALRSPCSGARYRRSTVSGRFREQKPSRSWSTIQALFSYLKCGRVMAAPRMTKGPGDARKIVSRRGGLQARSQRRSRLTAPSLALPEFDDQDALRAPANAVHRLRSRGSRQGHRLRRRAPAAGRSRAPRLAGRRCRHARRRADWTRGDRAARREPRHSRRPRRCTRAQGRARRRCRARTATPRR